MAPKRNYPALGLMAVSIGLVAPLLYSGAVALHRFVAGLLK